MTTGHINEDFWWRVIVATVIIMSSLVIYGIVRTKIDQINKTQVSKVVEKAPEGLAKVLVEEAGQEKDRFEALEIKQLRGGYFIGNHLSVSVVRDTVTGAQYAIFENPYGIAVIEIDTHERESHEGD
ncbi:MAG: hypothetical protein DRP45_12050 [Candidatus Zixiibacteriota bacterium]|nr:MAG: hypothetical protein DRP45_12050 [candidate division Zixibacteria bacterium]